MRANLNALIETELKRAFNKVVSEEKDIKLLKEYGLYEMFYENVSRRLYEEYNKEDEDYEEFKFILGRLRELVPVLMKRLISKGFHKAVKFIADKAKEGFKGNHKVMALKGLLFSLVMLCIAISGDFVNKYNSKPILPDTQIEYYDDVEDDVQYLVVTDVKNSDEVCVIEQENDGMPEIIEKTDKVQKIVEEIKEKKKASTGKKNEKTSVKEKYNSPIVLLNNTNIKKSDYYKISDSMIEALMAVEDYSAVIYDAKNPKRKNIDMNNMKQDLTIGYGHKLTKEERKKWSKDKRMSKEEAKQLFIKDLKETERYLNKKLAQLPYDKKVEYSQGFIDGMGSLLFNMGYGNMFGAGKREESEFWSRLNKCRIDKNNNCMNVADINFSIAAVRNQNITQRGHIARRKAEYSIMMQPYGSLDNMLYNLKTKTL